jgi:hypothetical protein
MMRKEAEWNETIGVGSKSEEMSPKTQRVAVGGLSTMDEHDDETPCLEENYEPDAEEDFDTELIDVQKIVEGKQREIDSVKHFGLYELRPSA